MKDYKFKKNITCSDPVVCSDKVVHNLKNRMSLILKPQVQNGIHNGWIDIVHTQGDHEFNIHIFTETNNAIFIKKPTVMPTLNNIRAKII